MHITYTNSCKALIAGILSFANMFCFGQSIPKILTVDKFQKGIYKDFEEFLNDAPSIYFDFELNRRSKSKKLWFGGSDFDLDIKDTVVAKNIKKGFWGFSTGDSLFVNSNNFQKNTGFQNIFVLGRYCIMRGIAPSAQIGPAFGLLGVAITSAQKDAAYVLNVNNGKFFLLDKFLMLRILADDAELLADFKSAKRKNDPETFMFFIKEYNKRHEDQIKHR